MKLHKNIINKTTNRSFVKDSFNYLVGQILTMGISFLSIPIFTNLLSEGDYGKVAIVFSTTAIISPLLMMGFHGSIVNKYVKTPEECASYLGTILLFLLFSISFIVICLTFVGSNIASYFSIDEKVFWASVISSILMVPILLYNSYMVAIKRSKEFVFLSFLTKALAFLLSVGLILYFLNDHRFWGRIFGQIGGLFIVATWSIFKLIKNSEFKFIKKHLVFGLQFGLPLIPHSLSGVILADFDKIIINDLTGDRNTGIYSIGYNIGTIMFIIVSSLNQAWVPRFYENMKKKSVIAIEKMAIQYSLVVSLFAVFLIFFSREILLILVNERFYSAISIVPIIVLSGYEVFLYTLYVNYAFYKANTKLIALNTIIAVCVNLRLNYSLIPIYGYEVAAITTLISYFVLFLLHFINAKYVLKMDVVKLIKLVPATLLLISFTILFYFLEFLSFSFGVNLFIKILIIGSMTGFVAKALFKSKKSI